MNLSTEILDRLNEIYRNRENSYDLMDVFQNFKIGRKILLVKAGEHQAFTLDDHVVMNIADNIPLELIERLSETVQDYIDEQNRCLTQVQVSNLPWKENSL